MQEQKDFLLELEKKIADHNKLLKSKKWIEIENVYNSQVEYVKYRDGNCIVILYPTYYEVGYIDFKDSYYKVTERVYSNITEFVDFLEYLEFFIDNGN